MKTKLFIVLLICSVVVTTSCEKDKDEGGPAFVNPKIEFDKASYELKYESVYDQGLSITATLSDSIGPLEDKEITVEVKKGSLSKNKLKTNKDGKIFIIYVAPDNSCTDGIRVTWTYTNPDGSSKKLSRSAKITVTAPIRQFDGQVIINTTSSVYSPSKADQRESNTTTYAITGKIRCLIIRERIIMYRDDPAKRTDLGVSVLNGSSNNVERDPNDYSKIIKDEKYPLFVKEERTRMGYKTVKKEEKYVQTYVAKAEGSNDIEGLSLEIKPYKSTSSQYVIRLAGGKYLDKMSMHPEGSGSNQEWDDVKECLKTAPGPYGIGIPYSVSEPDYTPGQNEVYEQLIIADATALDAFLLKPEKPYIIYASGKRHNKVESNYETEGSVSVSITLNPTPPPPPDPDDVNW